jgi:hypothetical protein
VHRRYPPISSNATFWCCSNRSCEMWLSRSSPISWSLQVCRLGLFIVRWEQFTIEMSRSRIRCVPKEWMADIRPHKSNSDETPWSKDSICHGMIEWLIEYDWIISLLITFSQWECFKTRWSISWLSAIIHWVSANFLWDGDSKFIEMIGRHRISCKENGYGFAEFSSIFCRTSMYNNKNDRTQMGFNKNNNNKNSYSCIITIIPE